MLNWLRERGKDVIAFREILQFRPSPLRKPADAALAVLMDHGWITDAFEGCPQDQADKGSLRNDGLPALQIPKMTSVSATVATFATVSGSPGGVASVAGAGRNSDSRTVQL